MSFPSFSRKGRIGLCGIPFGALLLACAALGNAQAQQPDRVRIPGHVLPALEKATPVADESALAQSAPVALTIVLERTDLAGFERYLRDLYDPASPSFRRYSSPREVADRFGPSVEDYAAVKGYFSAEGLDIGEESANRLTLVISGTRERLAQALGTEIREYEIAGHAFSANVGDPELPADIARRVHAIAGLATLAQPQPMIRAINRFFCKGDGEAAGYNKTNILQDGVQACRAAIQDCTAKGKILAADEAQIIGVCDQFHLGQNPRPAVADGAPVPWKDADGSGQTIGIVAFDTYETSDVADYLDYFGMPPGSIGNLSNVHVGGGASAGADQSEVLLDVDTVMLAAPGASVVVYDAPFSGAGTFQSVFNRMINDGVTIISNSWAYCEDQTTLADVTSIDSVLAAAAASGVTVFSAAGDSGSTCLDGSPNTIVVPAGSPHAVAVGGTTMTTDIGAIYLGETWWDGSSLSPPAGQGGFGTSRFFARPDFQTGFTGSSMRSIPDVSFNADPYEGVVICQASAGGCPAPLFFGGTSGAAPAWAAGFAVINQALGSNVGHFNAAAYPLANSGAFHTPASMGSDFAHVGLGSPKFNALYLALAGTSPGAASATVSTVTSSASAVSADGATEAVIVVHLMDADGNSIAGKTVALTGNAGSSVVITPPSAVTSPNNGAVVFRAKNSTVEDVTFTARDTTDNLTLAQTVAVSFMTPTATSGGIMAFPTMVAANGTDTTSITITLRDAENRPTPGKEIALAQNGRSVVTGPTPPVTDASGQIVFTATDAFEETVTYTAVDVTDGDLPVPGTASVTFSGSAAGSCVTPPQQLGDYTLTSFVNGFAAYPFFYGNTNFGCSGATDTAFDAEGNVYVAHLPTGDLYKLGQDGGAAAAPLSNLGPTLRQPLFDGNGRLYAAQTATTGDFTTGDIIEIDPVTGAELRVLASNLTCPHGLAFDPLSGDLFFDDNCTGAGSDNPAIFRLTNPSGMDPMRPTEVTVYTTLPSTPNGMLSFAPDGTLYAATVYGDCQHSPLIKITGTNGPSPPVQTTLDNVDSCYWLRVGAVDANGAATSLFVFNYDGTRFFLNLVDITTNPAGETPIATNLGSGTIGTDGCLYTTGLDTIYKIAPASGICDFAATNPSATLTLTPREVTPNPQQGSTLTLTATFRNIAVPEGTSVFLRISGANGQTQFGRTDSDGTATITYEGRFAGDDVVFADAIVGGVGLVSNDVRVHWESGPHASFLSILEPVAATAGVPAAVTAALADVAVDPQQPIAGAPVHFSAGSQSCDAATGADGVASCAITFPNPGAYTLAASYAGTAQILASSQSVLVAVPSDGIDLIFEDGFDGD